jgi:CRP-like cAMP-binding protein
MPRVTTKRLKLGSHLCDVGDPAKELWHLREGILEVYRFGELIAEIYNGVTFGESSLVNEILADSNQSRTASVVAKTDVSIMVIPSELFSKNYMDFHSKGAPVQSLFESLYEQILRTLLFLRDAALPHPMTKKFLDDMAHHTLQACEDLPRQLASLDSWEQFSLVFMFYFELRNALDALRESLPLVHGIARPIMIINASLTANNATAVLRNKGAIKL